MLRLCQIRCVLITALIAAALTGTCCAQEEKVDGPPGHQEEWRGLKLHACPAGYAMAGANVVDNRLTCVRIVPQGKEGTVTSVLDGGTQGNLGDGDIHICPSGMYMRGLHNGQNKLLCSSDPFSHLGVSFLDARGSTQGNDMHICPRRNGKATVMTGIRNDKDDFACAEVR